MSDDEAHRRPKDEDTAATPPHPGSAPGAEDDPARPLAPILRARALLLRARAAIVNGIGGSSRSGMRGRCGVHSTAAGWFMAECPRRPGSAARASWRRCGKTRILTYEAIDRPRLRAAAPTACRSSGVQRISVILSRGACPAGWGRR
jgi:hypothetical protein